MAAAATTLALMLAACGSADSDDSADSVASVPVAGDTAEAGSDSPTSEPPTDSAAATARPATDDAAAPTPTDAVVVPDILQFSAPLVGGGTFDGAAVAGIPTAFWFWAPT